MISVQALPYYNALYHPFPNFESGKSAKITRIFRFFCNFFTEDGVKIICPITAGGGAQGFVNHKILCSAGFPFLQKKKWRVLDRISVKNRKSGEKVVQKKIFYPFLPKFRSVF